MLDCHGRTDTTSHNSLYSEQCRTADGDENTVPAIGFQVSQGVLEVTNTHVAPLCHIFFVNANDSHLIDWVRNVAYLLESRHQRA